MEKYNHKTIESKWQKKWEKDGLYKTKEGGNRPSQAGGRAGKKKYYILDMFPYPSGSGLHVGHPKGYIATDIFARMKMLQGYNVLHPMGWDAFGLPAENYALKNKVHPRKAVEENVARFKKQLGKIGFTYDRDREINTTDPEYYKWTQWIFVQMFKKGLAYESEEPINWCPSCRTGLANEDLEDGKCEQCGSEIERKPMIQWMLKITDYADRLLDDLEKLPDWEEAIKEMQRNWIGKSEGAMVRFAVIARTPLHAVGRGTKQSREGSNVAEPTGLPRPDNTFGAIGTRNDSALEVFTTRPDTLFGCTFMVIAPEHFLIKNSEFRIQNYAEVKKYVEKAKKKSEMERTDLTKEKTGVKLEGVTAINPVNNKEIPIFVADYVMISYGTGAIMAVPAHDERDWEFAKKYNIEIKPVVLPSGGSFDIKKLEEIIHPRRIRLGRKRNCEKEGKDAHIEMGFEEIKNKKAFCGEGINWNSHNDEVSLDGLKTPEAIKKMTAWLEEKKLGKSAVNYKLKDWVFSRQRYWGEPIPIVHCKKCKEKDKKTVLLIHGTGGHGRKNWFGWLADELHKLGHEVIAPNLPNADEPVLEEWMAELNKYKDKLGDKAIVIGHSLGGPAALQLVSELNKKIDKLILVAPTSRGMDWEEFAKQHPDFPIIKIKTFSDININFDKISKNTNNVLFYYSDNDVYIQDASNEYYKKNLKAEYKLFKGYNHFSVNQGGFYEFPEILEEIVGQEPLPAGKIPVPEEELPVELPEVEHYEPTGTGESPLANIEEWVNIKCPKCNGPAKRETNTMPQWAGSSWYWLRYIDAHNDKVLVDKKKEKYWSPVDFYVGGAEHATRHLIYARFWHKFLYDIGVVNYEEPFTRLQHVGLVLAEDGRKMSKRWKNVINPDDIVAKFGADSMRLYEMFMGPFSQPCAWSMEGIKGVRRFLEKIWVLSGNVKRKTKNVNKANRLVHKTIKKVGEDIEGFKFNTAIAQMMILVNEMGQEKEVAKQDFEIFLKVLAPFTPHMAEELWSAMGNKESIFKQPWPKYDKKLVKDEIINLVVQVNGKVRDMLEVPADISEDEAREKALGSEKVQKWTKDGEVVKVIFVKGKLVNIVVK